MAARPFLAALVLSAAIAAADGDAVPSVRVTVADRGGAASVPVTFGQAFRRGQFPASARLSAGGRAVPAQVDVKRRHDDGSVRFAVVSTMLDSSAGASPIAMTLEPGGEAAPASAPAVSSADLLKTDFDAVVTLRFPDGAVRAASARTLLERAGDAAPTWLRGPIVTEWLLAGPPLDERGSPDEDLSVRFEVRAYRGVEQVRVSIAVESCWDTWAGNIRYDVAISSGGRERFSRRAVDHRPLSRWRKVFWWGRAEETVHVAHDLAYLASIGAVPNYDRSLPAPTSSAARPDAFAMEGPDWDLMGRGPLTAYMPTTGGRPEIAPYPLWTVRFLLTMDPRAKALVLSAGDLAGSWPIHVRARETGRIMTIDRRPEFWLDERGKDRPHWKAPRHAPDSKQVQLAPDLAHQPSLAHVPFLVSGDFYYLEEAYFWGNYNLLATWPHPRRNERGILEGQIRGDAWGLRNLADAAWVAPDGDPERRYFEEKIRNNIADRILAMYGPPEFNAIGAWGLRTVEDARVQNPANPRWIITAPWEEDYLLWSLHHLVELGWSDAGRPRDFLLRLRVGMLTHAADFDPRLATPYRLVVGEWRTDRTPAVYDDWRTLGSENARLSKPDIPNYGCSYAYSARAALICGIDAGFPRAREALEALEALLPGHREIMAGEPYWAIAPGGAASGAGKPSSAASPKAAPAEWLRWGMTSDAPLWGLRGGLIFGIHPGGARNDGGPRGLIRIRYPVLPKGEHDLVNFIAIEPVVAGRKGFSELEQSLLDGVRGKRIWPLAASGEPGASIAPDHGTLTALPGGAEQLRVTLRVERFENGAHVRVDVTQRSDAADEIELAVHAEPGSAPMEYCILTSTMGNKARARLLWLKDAVASSLRLYPDYTGDGFAPHTVYPLERLHRTPEGDVLAAVTTDEEDPAAVFPFPGTRRWYYGGNPVTQYWRKPVGSFRENLEIAVNARSTYWMSRRQIPGGIAFENFEMRERFREGQRFVFGVTRRTPAQLGFTAAPAAR